MKKALSLLLALVMITGRLAGGAGGGKDGGTLTIYTWEGLFPQEILDGFEKETGITVNYQNFDFDETMLAKLEAAEGGDYDLVIADDYIIETAIAEA